MRKLVLSLCMAFSVMTFALAGQPFSGKMDTESVKEVCNAVTKWQIDNFGTFKHHNLSWTNGTLYRGMFEWADLNNDQDVFDFLIAIGTKHNWILCDIVYHADAICVGQTYIKMYEKFGDPKMLQPTMERAFYVASHPSTAALSMADSVGKRTRWAWCDALFMAPPVYAALYRLTGEKVYADYLDSEFRICTDSLYDTKEKLYYRDCHRIAQREPNGKKQFWGRGNGWVFGGISLILRDLPKNHPTIPYYEKIFMEMAESVVATQDQGGAWHASLLDPVAYAAPENSASSFFCYGLAWGIRNGYLKDAKYCKALEKGWKSLVSYVNAEGKLGFVQPIGASPVQVSDDSTDVYGVGAFLLAGSEITRLISGQ